MEEPNLLISTSLLLFFFVFLSKFILKKRIKRVNLPPSPPALPVIGHLHLMNQKQPLHRSLQKLIDKYGPIMFLRFGSRKVLVVSSPSAIEECFTKNDITFANRPRTLAGKHLGYNYKGLGFASYGDHWRNLRRLTTLELLSTNRLATFTWIREEEVQMLVKQLFQECRAQPAKVQPRPGFTELAFYIILRMVSGKRYYDNDAVTQEVKQFQAQMKEVAELGGANLNDFFPILQWVDISGIEKRMVTLIKKVDNFVQNIIDEHRLKRSLSAGKNEGKMSMIDVMLSKQEIEPEFYTDENIRGVVAAMLIAGSETTATALEWALTLLLNHPEAMHKLKTEIDTNLGQDRLINESDISKLSYLQNVITETLRLYPVVPFLIPHESSEDCTVGGYHVPRGTMLLANLCTVHKDASVWPEPERFMPERFEGGGGQGGGEGYSLIPFGAGRRACPGTVSAKRVMGQALGALIQCFDWQKTGPGEMNMSEGVGLTLPKLEPLVALCSPRPGMTHILSNL